MLQKKVAKILLGSASPAQLFLACIVGATLGFMPGLTQAAGSILLLSLLLLILNCNLALAAGAGLVAKLLSLLLMPLTFSLGRLLLDGPLQGLFTALINAPVLALFGFEYYVTSGGLVMGGLLGSAMGLALVKAVAGIRTRLANAEANSEAFNAMLENPATRLLIRTLLGPVPTSGYAELLKSKPAPIRRSGVIAAVILLGATYGGIVALSGPLATGWLQSALERANGATVDIGSASIDLQAGAFSLTGLAIADPNALTTDLFRANRITMDISAADLLRKRVRIDAIEIDGAENGATRETPGELFESPAPPPSESEGDQSKGLDGYLAAPDDWRKRMSQVKGWFDTVSNSGAGDLMDRLANPLPGDASTEQAETQTLEEWLEREIQAQGYTHISANHLIQGSPILQIDQIHAPNTTTSLLENQLLDIEVRNFSTQPHLIDQGPSMSIRSHDKTIDLALEVGSASAGGGVNHLGIALTNLPTDALADQLSSKHGKVSGGTVDIRLEGNIEDRQGAWIDLPLTITANNTTVTFSGQNLPVDQLEIPVRLRGPLDNFEITVDEEAVFASLSRAAAGVLEDKAKALVSKELNKATGGLIEGAGGESGGLLDKIGGKKGIGGLFGR